MRRSHSVDRLDPSADGALRQVALAHRVRLGLPRVYELDYLPLELVGEMPGGGASGPPWAPPDSSGPHETVQLSIANPHGGPQGGGGGAEADAHRRGHRPAA